MVPWNRFHRKAARFLHDAEEGRTRAARAKNRRVEVKVFSADQVTASVNGENANRSQENK